MQITRWGHTPPRDPPSPKTLSNLSQHALTRVDLLSTLSQSPLNVTNRFQTRYSIQSFSAFFFYTLYMYIDFLYPVIFYGSAASSSSSFPQFVTLWSIERALFLTLWPSNAHFLNFSTLIVESFSVSRLYNFVSNAFHFN